MRVAVLGAGTGGLASTVELTRADHEVQLWNRNSTRLLPHRHDGVRYRGIWGEGTARPVKLTSSLTEAVDGVDVIVVCLPSVAHPQLFAELADLKCTTPIILNPGHTGGALHLRNVFASFESSVPAVVEFSTLTVVGRVVNDVAVITNRANHVKAGALPGGDAAMELAIRLFPGTQPVRDVLASSLSNVNLVLHPPGAIFGAAWVEATSGGFKFYTDGMTRGVARTVSILDTERILVGRTYGHELPGLLEEMSAIGTVEAEAASRGDVLAAIRDGVANTAISAPDSVEHRYYQEDFAFGLLPFIALAEKAGIDIPVASALFKLGETFVGNDFYAKGLNAQMLGISDFSHDELIQSVLH